MTREVFTCIDAGSEFCPCKLALSGECLLCTQLQGKTFCNCTNWNGVCIYSEFCNNNYAAKKGRDIYDLEVLEVTEYKKDIIKLKLKGRRKLILDLLRPGSYVFARVEEDKFFDTPVSVIEGNIENNTIIIAIEKIGIKTKSFSNIKVKDIVKIRGPYWNGSFGVKELYEQREKSVLVIGRGIGIAPCVSVIKRLSFYKNNIFFIKDLCYLDDYVKDEIRKYDIEEILVNTLNYGNLSDEIKVLIKEKIEVENISHIYIGGGDILTIRIIEFLDSIGRGDITLSCCNNFKMCCGEGVCGACIGKFDGDKVKRFCKYQTDPRHVFEGRRFT